MLAKLQSGKKYIIPSENLDPSGPERGRESSPDGNARAHSVCSLSRDSRHGVWIERAEQRTVRRSPSLHGAGTRLEKKLARDNTEDDFWKPGQSSPLQTALGPR